MARRKYVRLLDHNGARPEDLHVDAPGVDAELDQELLDRVARVLRDEPDVDVAEAVTRAEEELCAERKVARVA